MELLLVNDFWSMTVECSPGLIFTHLEAFSSSDPSSLELTQYCLCLAVGRGGATLCCESAIRQ